MRWRSSCTFVNIIMQQMLKDKVHEDLSIIYKTIAIRVRYGQKNYVCEMQIMTSRSSNITYQSSL